VDFQDLKAAYNGKRAQYGDRAYLHISELFDEIREQYKQEYLTSPKAQRLIAQGKTPDPEQSWKPFKGHNFEKLIAYIVKEEIESLGLRVTTGDSLARKRLSPELNKVYRNLLVRYGEYAILPDADLVIYRPGSCEVIGIVSHKITLRERVAQTAYWKLKLAADCFTCHIKGYFITTDEDGHLTKRGPEPHRNRIIVEHELDGTYVLREVEESEKVKSFPKFIEDLRKLVSNAR